MKRGGRTGERGPWAGGGGEGDWEEVGGVGREKSGHRGGAVVMAQDRQAGRETRQAGRERKRGRDLMKKRAGKNWFR